MKYLKYKLLWKTHLINLYLDEDEFLLNYLLYYYSIVYFKTTSLSRALFEFYFAYPTT